MSPAMVALPAHPGWLGARVPGPLACTRRSGIARGVGSGAWQPPQRLRGQDCSLGLGAAETSRPGVGAVPLPPRARAAGRGARGDLQRCAAGQAPGAWSEPWDPEPRPWQEFLADIEMPPSTTAWRQRVRLNARYYRTNYALMVGGATLFNALVVPVVFLGFAVCALSAAVTREYWVNVVLAPPFFRVTRRRLDLHMTLDGNKVMTVSAPDGGVTASGTPIAPHTYNPYQVSLYLLLGGSFLLFANSVMAFVVLIAGIKLGGTAGMLHMSLRRPNLSSTISGLGSVASREELNENLRSIWDQLRGKSGER